MELRTILLMRWLNALLIALVISLPAHGGLNGFTLTGDPTSANGASWTYTATVDGVAYDLSGLLFKPSGEGPFPAVIISHGFGGNARGYASNIAREMRNWGLVGIATNYTHAAGVPLGAPGTVAELGASDANLLRAHKLWDILASLSYVDMRRVAAHGHSMGAFVTAALVGIYPKDFRVASHTAGGVHNLKLAWTKEAQANGITAPYQMHHGDADTVVPLEDDQSLDALLQTKGTAHQLRVYAGYGHNAIPFDPTMYQRVRDWYTAHGLFDTTVAAATTVSAASYRGAPLAAEAIVAAFGSRLSTTTLAAAALPLPTSLGGTSVKVRDGAGLERPAPLFFVSPAQINYLIPAGSVTGAATVTVTSGDGTISGGEIRIAPVAPGVFTADSSGQGLAAAIALRIRGDGSQSFEPVAQFDAAQNKFVAVPIDLGPDLGGAADQVFLLVFGTGLRNLSALSAVRTRIGDVDAQATFAGAQGGFEGLDQVNVRLPRILAGRGEVNVELVVDGQAANPIRISVK
ncbi:MAG TPA: prolyl oligopeptidase family serine peptidase [Blastocatellia bacterium]|nr:prolyl oligopeptidase family serine peptidase [Blastocatellia bacterium]